MHKLLKCYTFVLTLIFWLFWTVMYTICGQKHCGSSMNWWELVANCNTALIWTIWRNYYHSCSNKIWEKDACLVVAHMLHIENFSLYPADCGTKLTSHKLWVTLNKCRYIQRVQLEKILDAFHFSMLFLFAYFNFMISLCWHLQVKTRTANDNSAYGSHVMQFGDIGLNKENLYMYMGTNPANDNYTFVDDNTLKSPSKAVNQRDADLLHFWAKVCVLPFLYDFELI